MITKFAIIGCGRISKNHLDAIEHAPHAKLVAVCDIDESKVQKAAFHLATKIFTIGN